MKKLILAITAFVLITSVNIVTHAQTTKKKPVETPQTTTLDAWRQALPGVEITETSSENAIPQPEDNFENKESAVDIEARIIDTEQKLLKAIKQRDAGTLNYLLADDFVLNGINIAGPQTDKSRFINWTSKDLEVKSYKIDKLNVTVYDTTAIARVKYKRQATTDGLPSDGDFTVTNVWVKRGDLWQLVSHHISELPKTE